MVARKGENYGGKEGGELKGGGGGGDYSGFTHVTRYGSRSLDAGYKIILTHQPVHFQRGMTGKPAEQAKT